MCGDVWVCWCTSEVCECVWICGGVSWVRCVWVCTCVSVRVDIWMCGCVSEVRVSECMYVDVCVSVWGCVGVLVYE